MTSSLMMESTPLSTSSRCRVFAKSSLIFLFPLHGCGVRSSREAMRHKEKMDGVEVDEDP
ncbi:hypothetical protein E2C01_060707 [Portunus trituberculatus]|uniref:Uncharacterized protein n=1 Tax=Portunus trituberculatus TaxID=210409 RepID=A0A5B7HC76_PORTR|nr:hypothetical protein [Portunus trituberculatus]